MEHWQSAGHEANELLDFSLTTSASEPRTTFGGSCAQEGRTFRDSVLKGILNAGREGEMPSEV